MACAADYDEQPDSDRADLPADCTTDATDYLAWLRAARQSPEFDALVTGQATDLVAFAAHVDSKPCASGDDAYLPWLGLFDHQWQTSVTPSERDWNIDAQEALVFDAILSLAPFGSGAVGYRDWLATYDTTLMLATRPVLENNQVLEQRNETNEDEEIALQHLEAAWPGTSARGAYALWIQSYDAQLTKAVDPIHETSIDDQEGGLLDRFAEVAPEASEKSSYLQWFVLHEARFGRAIAILGPESDALSENELSELGRLTGVMPEAFGEKPYLVWLSMFASRLSDVISSTGDFKKDTDAAQLSHLLSIRPCGNTPLIQEKWARIEAVGTRVQPSVADMITGARPTECMEQL